jgi:sugar/nucleoside kinase (ribokinase family)
MFKQFATRSPRAATGLIFAAGYAAGTLLGLLAGYLVSSAWKTSAAIAVGMACGTLALNAAQRRGLVPEPQELNKPISLFGPGGFHGDGSK